jgi:signal transduction histidine kinase
MLLERLIDNLLGNAMKYTPSDAPIDVRVRETGGEAMLEVADRGPGIADADRERIFERFYRGASAEGTEGLGLGLAFVAEIARWHGGAVRVENRPGGGALFRVTLPAFRGAT